MALRLDYTDGHQVPHPLCYVRITRFALDFEQQTARVDMGYYHDEAARRNGALPFHRRDYEFPSTVLNRALAYVQLKATRPEFTNAADVLEA